MTHGADDYDLDAAAVCQLGHGNERVKRNVTLTLVPSHTDSTAAATQEATMVLSWPCNDLEASNDPQTAAFRWSLLEGLSVTGSPVGVSLIKPI
jgi:hypothetical protein